VRRFSLEDRAAYFRARFPKNPDAWPVVSPTGRWLTATWFTGAHFQNRSRYYGAYPPIYLARALGLFPELDGLPAPAARGTLLHAFSGSLPAGPYTRLDSQAHLRPDVVGDVVAPPPGLGPFAVVLADPPYSAEDAALYGTPALDVAAAMRGLARLVARHGMLLWLDQKVPTYRGDQWRQVGLVTVVRSTNQRLRGASLFERR
jgi:hypothetical protein